MTRIFVNIQLEILIVQKEASTVFENRDVMVVPLSKHIIVVSLCQRVLHLNHLSMKLWSTYCVCVAKVILRRQSKHKVEVEWNQIFFICMTNAAFQTCTYQLATFPQPGLHLRTICLQIVMDDSKVLKAGREMYLVGQWPFYQKLDLFGICLQPILCVYSQLLANRL